jgi:4-aminobutyrate aminotransferase/(S)-3-amino-2-methylpropionate transaminase
MTMTGKAKPYKHGFGPFAPEVYRAPMAYPYRWPSGPQHCAREAMTQFAQLIDAQIGADMVAAVVVEPIQGEGGFIVPADGFLSAVAEFCRSRGIVLVADEVQTGIARTGSWFACEHDGLVPDLIVTAKGLAGGLPLAAVTGRAEIMDAAPPGGIGGTYSGNPAACAAALGSIEEIEDNDLLARARRIGERLTAGLRSINTPVIGEVRGRGAMIAAELVRPGTRDPNPEAVAAVTRYCHDHGVLTLSAGTFGNVLRFLPPLSITDELLDDAMGVLADAFAAL